MRIYIIDVDLHSVYNNMYRLVGWRIHMFDTYMHIYKLVCTEAIQARSFDLKHLYTYNFSIYNT